MRTRPLITALLVPMVLTGCSAPIDRSGAEAGPAGSPSARASSSPSQASSSKPSATGSTGTPTRAADPTASGARRPGTQIRRTDWPDAVIRNLGFCGEVGGTVRFRNGSNGNDIPCTILPNGARPVYADFVAEEPANAPATEDALLLVELGNPGAARQQALAPIQLGYDGRTLEAGPVIKGDQPDATGTRVMTFLSYRVVGGHVEATVRRLDGRTETRRWRGIGGGAWERF